MRDERVQIKVAGVAALAGTTLAVSFDISVWSNAIDRSRMTDGVEINQKQERAVARAERYAG
jgi:hypothetical protein